ncbi:hypothetical protein ACIQGZ_17490 [Streptomyces sp. NPDC092296]|uniref:hypothetical protein n=1 Tax=Streptomyces sp. NPDC092296 TaxID=3366012 RepID=UPI00382B4C64
MSLIDMWRGSGRRRFDQTAARADLARRDARIADLEHRLRQADRLLQHVGAEKQAALYANAVLRQQLERAEKAARQADADGEATAGDPPPAHPPRTAPLGSARPRPRDRPHAHRAVRR